MNCRAGGARPAPCVAGGAEQTGPTSSVRWRMFMMIFRGLSAFPVMFAGQTDVHLPQSVQVRPSSSCFQVRSRMSSAPNFSAFHPRGRPSEGGRGLEGAEIDIGYGGQDVQVLRVRQVIEESEDYQDMVHQKIPCHNSPDSPVNHGAAWTDTKRAAAVSPPSAMRWRMCRTWKRQSPGSAGGSEWRQCARDR